MISRAKTNSCRCRLPGRTLQTATQKSIQSVIRPTLHHGAKDADGRPPPGAFTEICKKPIAIVGLAAKLPGDATSSEALWEMLVRDKPDTTAPPSDRFFFGAHHLIHGEGADVAFDHKFFGMSHRESFALDPQRRVLLAVIYEALESADLDQRPLVFDKFDPKYGMRMRPPWVRSPSPVCRRRSEYVFFTSRSTGSTVTGRTPPDRNHISHVCQSNTMDVSANRRFGGPMAESELTRRRCNDLSPQPVDEWNLNGAKSAPRSYNFGRMLLGTSCAPKQNLPKLNHVTVADRVLAYQHQFYHTGSHEVLVEDIFEYERSSGLSGKEDEIYPFRRMPLHILLSIHRYIRTLNIMKRLEIPCNHNLGRNSTCSGSDPLHSNHKPGRIPTHFDYDAHTQPSEEDSIHTEYDPPDSFSIPDSCDLRSSLASSLVYRCLLPFWSSLPCLISSLLRSFFWFLALLTLLGTLTVFGFLWPLTSQPSFNPSRSPIS